MLDPSTFNSIIENAPRMSSDRCLVYKGNILVGRRNNQLLKGECFTPDGRIFENEHWQECIRRVADSELGLVIGDFPSARLMGIWGHFFKNSVVDENVSTHYINLLYEIILKERPKLSIDKQHTDMSWFDRSEVAGKDDFHEYMQNYASWLINGYEND